jgi:hypothetical protein
LMAEKREEVAQSTIAHETMRELVR